MFRTGRMSAGAALMVFVSMSLSSCIPVIIGCIGLESELVEEPRLVGKWRVVAKADFAEMIWIKPLDKKRRIYEISSYPKFDTEFQSTGPQRFKIYNIEGQLILHLATDREVGGTIPFLLKFLSTEGGAPAFTLQPLNVAELKKHSQLKFSGSRFEEKLESPVSELRSYIIQNKNHPNLWLPPFERYEKVIQEG